MTEMDEKRLEVRRWRRIVFVASLVLNLFLLAVIGGHVLRHNAVPETPGAPMLARALANAEASLSPPDAAAFRAIMTRDAPQYVPAARQLGEARAALERQIVAEPFNRQAVHEAFAAWQASWNHFLDTADNPMVDALAHVSPEGRRKLIAGRQAARKDNPAP
jgi:uncharacterized membrane protein